MVNTDKLKARMRELHITQAQLADKLNVKQSTLSLKINRERPMFVDEADVIREALQIQDSEIRSYFFNAEIA